MVTGGGSGIGRATALALGAKGARVVVADVNVDGRRQRSPKACGGTFVRTDVTDAADVDAPIAGMRRAPRHRIQ